MTSAVTSAAGVTSNAGLRHGVPASVSSAPPAWRTSSASRSSISISSPLAIAASIVDVGPATTNGIPAARAASAWAYVPTLLATSPLAATRSQPTMTASTSPRRMSPAAAPSTSSSWGMPARRSSQIVSRAPCSSGRVSHASTDSSPRAASSATTASAEPVPPHASVPVLQCVRIRARPGEQVGAVRGDRGARGVLGGVDRLGLGARHLGARARRDGEHRRLHAVDRPREVDRRRPRGLRAAAAASATPSSSGASATCIASP